MKLLGLMGGMSWESSAEYYRLMNRLVQERWGGSHSCRCLLHSQDFSQVEELQHRGDWEALGNLLVNTARSLEAAGAQGLVLCTNTMHKLAPMIEEAVPLPLLHIADAAGRAIKSKGFSTVGLLGTRFTMEQDFYSGRLRDKFGLEVLIPEERERDLIHRVIYHELIKGQFTETSREAFKRIISSLATRGAQGVILGCTEIPLLVRQEDTPVPLFDTTALHATLAVDFALEGKNTITDAFWKNFCRTAEQDKPRGEESYSTWSFGNSPEMADKLLDLVLEGRKRGTASLLQSYKAERVLLPEQGGYSILLDGKGAPKAVIRNLKVDILPFSSVTRHFAEVEGEGDLTLEWWRQVHRVFFTSEAQSLGLTFTEESPVVCEEFQLVYPWGKGTPGNFS